MMELAATYRAAHLQAACPLEEIVERVRMATDCCHDHPNVILGATKIDEEGAWAYNGQAGKLTRHALRQLCERLALPTGGPIPAGYIARCPNPLAAENLNCWLRKPRCQEPPVLVRIRQKSPLGAPVVRAVLSSRYGVVDHRPLMEPWVC